MGLQKIQLGSKIPQQNFSKSLLSVSEPEKPSCNIVYTESPFLETTVSTGFVHNDKPVVAPPPPQFDQKSPSHIKEDSIIDTIDTGFGENNTISQDCPKPEYKVPLYKENYLSEFKGETEKAMARENLGVYGKSDINRIVSEIIANDTSTFITVVEVEKMLENLDFVNSTLRAQVNYDIPNNLFRL